MLVIKVMISNGEDTGPYRDIALDALGEIQHHLSYNANVPLLFANWDYRRDGPAVIPVGTMAQRSLSMVRSSECLLAIFGPTVPKITREEVLEAFEMRARGENMTCLMFMNPTQLVADHRDLLDEITSRFGVEVRFSQYTDPLQFQARVMTSIFGYLALRLTGQPVVGAGGRP